MRTSKAFAIACVLSSIQKASEAVFLFGLLPLCISVGLRPNTEKREREGRRETMRGSGKVVCVTGASGYIASWLVKLLLQRGYTVRATVRDLADPKKTEHLHALEGANGRLHLFKANLLEEGSFDSVVEGCEGVFHTASPFYENVIDPQAELIDPAVKGTLNVFSSCIKTPSVKRLVVTSSMAAVIRNGRPLTPDVVVDETWFSNAEYCKQAKWYVLSKTLAEEAAWKFSKDNSIDMVTINPAMVIGPLLQPTLNTSAAAILNLINGSSTYPNASFVWVNVKDVAIAHILAFEVPSASGRYCLVERVAHYAELVKILHEQYPALKLPEKCADDKPFVPIYQVSKEKVKSLGIDYIPLETSIKETVESLREKGFASF
uniref:Cinnamoyl-CoA reductase 2 isoform X2 n=1 Tax=Elaeis guineensis var. tenera TaxID=51953 RepID=A0A6I9QGP4_ELAGV|nr:cinnamoyl-CoA reductase 2 isoform X2 [Elaeis guineensis]